MVAKTNIKYFPFCPGIPWKTYAGSIIIPELPLELWYKTLKNREAIVVCHGGLIESFISLSYLEIINYLSPGTKLSWFGNSKFNDLVKLNGLGQICNLKLSPSINKNYPLPIFFDNKNHTYFNCLNNYLRIKSIVGGRGKGYQDRRPVIRQLLRNTLMEWDSHFLPQLRNLDRSQSKLSQWIQTTRFNFNQPFVLVFPESGFSQHKAKALGWNLHQVRALGTILKQLNIQTVVVTNQPGKYYGGAVECLPVDFGLILSILPKAMAILAEEPDFLLLGTIYPSIKLIGKPLKHELRLKNNSRFFNHLNDIYTIKALTPVDVFNILGVV